MLIFSLIILIVSVILHEVAHGYMANWLGDPTARLAGRLTLNPVPHIDPMGSIIIPALLTITGSPFRIGWAKPVPINPHYLTGKYDEALVAAAGPATNILLAVIFGVAMRFIDHTQSPLLEACAAIVILNLSLALFNLVPVPPLDGSRILSALVPGEAGSAYDRFRNNMEQYGMLANMFIILFVFYFLSPYFYSLLTTIFEFITGFAL